MNVTEILEFISYPENTLTLDFESFFSKDYTLEDLSIIEYVTDPRFEFTGLGIKINNTISTFISGPRVPWVIKRLQKKFGVNLHNATVVVKNSKFDILILAQKFGIYPPYVIDIEDLSRYYDSRMKHDLGALAKTFKLQAKGDTSQFKGQHCTDIDWAAMKKYCLGDVDLEYQLFEILLPMIDNPEIEFPLMQHTLNLYLKPTFDLDVKLANEIYDEMGQELVKDLDKVVWILEEYGTKKKKTIEDLLRARSIFPKILQDALDGYFEGEAVPMKLSPKPYKKTGKHELIPALAQQDVEFQLLLAHSDERVRNLCKAKAACTGWPLHMKKVQNLIKQTECFGDGIHIPLKFYGAHTGRWSGTQKWNPLNLGGKGNRKTGEQHHPLIGKIRHTLLAPNKYKLIIADSRQIEARELAWIAGQDDLVEDFRTGGDPYSTLATEIFGEPVWNPTEEEKETPEGKILEIRRGWGKDTELGAGFGLGPNTMYLNCRKNKFLRPMFDSGEYDWNFLDKLIKTYRAKRYMIPKFWKAVEKRFRWVTKYPHEVACYHIPGHEDEKPALRFWKEGPTTIIQLPSGRRLFYRHATVDRHDQIKYLHGYLWGGSITENIIQSICRDLLGGWLLECERQQIPIFLHLYDQLVGCVPKYCAERRLEDMIEIMNTGPDWAAGLPLDVEWSVSPCFKK